MNERIRELAEQAGLKIEYQMINPPKPLQILGSAEQFEKFAELIVKECANRATWAQDTSAADIGGEVLKHFGVEE